MEYEIYCIKIQIFLVWYSYARLIKSYGLYFNLYENKNFLSMLGRIQHRFYWMLGNRLKVLKSIEGGEYSEKTLSTNAPPNISLHFHSHTNKELSYHACDTRSSSILANSASSSWTSLIQRALVTEISISVFFLSVVPPSPRHTIETINTITITTNNTVATTKYTFTFCTLFTPGTVWLRSPGSISLLSSVLLLLSLLLMLLEFMSKLSFDFK